MSEFAPAVDGADATESTRSIVAVESTVADNMDVTESTQTIVGVGNIGEEEEQVSLEAQHSPFQLYIENQNEIAPKKNESHTSLCYKWIGQWLYFEIITYSSLKI